MLNYIWTGLIAFSLVFALVSDVRDASNDTYRNEQPLPVIIESDAPFDASARRQAVRVRIDPEQYKAFYGVEQVPAESFEGVVVQGADGREVRFAQGVGLPEPLNTIRDVTGSRDNQLLATVGALPDSAGTAFATTVTFRRVRFVKMNAIAGAAFDFAETAVSIALGLIGILALWLGLLRIAEKSGLIELLNRLVQPVLRPIFPEIPKDHPAMGLVALNITANMLGLGNAATPLGI
ncbi:MAG: nucleoside recognition domain-containing protein, partial [Bacteroidota bacterium]